MGIQNIPIAQPSLGEAEIEAVAEVIRSGWVTQGPEIARFESDFAKYTGSGYAVAVSNCTAALELSLRALDVKDGDEVITVSHSFIGTANAIKNCGAVPVFVDIDLATYNMDPSLIEQAITSRTRAVLCVHQIGMPCDLPAILEIADRRGLEVIEDAACAIGSEIRLGNEWRHIGNPQGKVACFSFHPRKLLTTGDGGMITTNDAQIATKLRRLRHHGMSVSDHERHGSEQIVFEEYLEVGFNYRLTDVQAAMGRVQLKGLDDRLRTRRDLAEQYGKMILQRGDVLPPHEPEWAKSNWQSYCVLLPPEVSQKSVMQQMLNRGISTRRGVMCAHLEPAYATEIVRAPLERSQKARDRGVILPLFEALTKNDLERVVDELHDAVQI